MFFCRFAFSLLALFALAFDVQAGEPTWKKRDINPKSAFEGAGVFDVDNDGKLDILSGDRWYKGPGFTQSYPVREVAKVGTYYNCFSTIPVDVNGDGRMDFVTCSYFDKNVGWVENPGSPGKTWSYHPIDAPGPSETAVAVDLTGDGTPEILPNTVNVVVWYELQSPGGEKPWKKFDFGAASAGHGVGTGDVNGDGRTDILTPKGWYEGPARPRAQTPWTFHPDWSLGAAGIQILAKDVDGDGLSDVVYGMGHDRGLYWIKQEEVVGDAHKFSKPTLIDSTLTSVHALVWADLDADGKVDELVTGKRVYAHEIETGDVEASQIAWFKFDKAAKSWKKHLVYQGEPAKNAPKDGKLRDAQKDFAPGTAGTGLELTVIDIDDDGDLDLVCPGKSGLYVFENLSKSKP
jgi:FG-GAP-like repeat/FG-GAP repeat